MPGAMDRECEAATDTVIAALDSQSPGHLTVTNTQLYWDKNAPNTSGTMLIAIVTVSDGSRHAFGVVCIAGPTCMASPVAL